MSSRGDIILKLLSETSSSIDGETLPKQNFRHRPKSNLFLDGSNSSDTATNNQTPNESVLFSCNSGEDIESAQVVIHDHGFFNIEGDGTLQQVDDMDLSLQGVNYSENVRETDSFSNNAHLTDFQEIGLSNADMQPVTTEFEIEVIDSIVGLQVDQTEAVISLPELEALDGLTDEVVEVPLQQENEFQEDLPHGNEVFVEKKSYMQTVDDKTKTGNTRKRKKYLFSPEERKKLKKTDLKEEHFVRDSCTLTCKLKCIQNVSQEMRLSINSQYWDLNRQEQKAFVVGCLTKNEVKRKTVLGDSRRSGTYQYFFRDTEGKLIHVCKTFFLTTLGFSKTNDKILQNVSNKVKPLVSPARDKRIGRKPHNKTDHSVIRNHIESFEPAIAHYRREHAPNRRYLPSDLSILQMHEDFKSKHTQVVCSYELYRSEVAKMNIAFVKLGNEECENCEHFSFHVHDKENLQQDCEECQLYQSHIEKAKSAREAYKQDAERCWQEGEIVYSVDLQKVIMLPRCEMFKAVVFTQRLSVYNESYVPVGNKNKEAKVGAVLWHEALRGRKKEEIISTTYKFLTTVARDAKSIIFWMDNCTGQNKNWTFFTFLVFCVNSESVCADCIEIKYLEPGHTFMSADSFHHRVEKSLHSMKKVYDFNDFKTAVEKSSKKVSVLEMKLEDFYEWKDHSYTRKKDDPRPYIRDLVRVRAQRGKNTLEYKVDMKETAEWKKLDFLIKKSKAKGVPFPTAVKSCRGISFKRKTGILEKLVTGKNSIVPENRFEFWNSLPTTSNGGLDDEELVQD